MFMKRILSFAVLAVLLAFGISEADVLPSQIFRKTPFRLPPVQLRKRSAGFKLSPDKDKLKLTLAMNSSVHYRYRLRLDNGNNVIPVKWTEGWHDAEKNDGETVIFLNYERPEEGKTLQYTLAAGLSADYVSGDNRPEGKVRWRPVNFRKNITVSNADGIIYVFVED